MLKLAPMLLAASLLLGCERGEEPQDIEPGPGAGGSRRPDSYEPARRTEEPRKTPETVRRPDMERNVPEKPAVEIPAGGPPTTLQQEDIRVGDGAEATPGKTVRVHYVGVAWSTKRQFDASWDRGRPFSFPLGQGRVIGGWDEGVRGMKVGGRRRLTIPPDMGYGARGSGDDIGPNETLVFVVDLLAVE